MKKDVATQWVAALRSGDYQQGKGLLRTPEDTFCCLGVLCNLHAIAHPEIAAEQQYREEYMGRQGILPSPVLAWSGMKTNHGAIFMRMPRLYGHTSLTGANDGGVSFARIADYIEENSEDL